MELIYESGSQVDLQQLNEAEQRREYCYRIIAPCRARISRIEIPTGLPRRGNEPRSARLTISWRSSDPVLPGRIRAEVTLLITEVRWYAVDLPTEIQVNAGKAYWIGLRGDVGPIGPQWSAFIGNDGEPDFIDPDNWIHVPASPELVPATEVFVFKRGRWQGPSRSGFAVRLLGTKEE